MRGFCLRAASLTLHFRNLRRYREQYAGSASFSRYKGHWQRSASEDTVMKKLFSGMCATALAAAFAVSSVVPVNAAPIFVPRAQAIQSQSDVIQIQDGFRFKKRLRRGGRNWNGNNFNRNWNGNNFRRNWNGNNFGNYRNFRRSGNFAAVRRGGNYGWYNGYRGYRVLTARLPLQTVSGSRQGRSSRARSSAARSPTATTIPGMPAAALTSSGATTASGLTARRTTPGSPITGRAGSAISPYGGGYYRY